MIAFGALLGCVAFGAYYWLGWMLGRAEARNGATPPTDRDWLGDEFDEWTVDDHGGYDRN